MIRDWNPRPIDQELASCNRYCLRLAPSTVLTTAAQGGKKASNSLDGFFTFPVTMRDTPTLTHNITGWTNGAPGTTTIAAINYGTNGNYTITGALTVSVPAANQALAQFRATAGTSFDGTVGQVLHFQFGPDVLAFLDAEL